MNGLNFFTPVTYVTPSKSLESSLLQTADNYFYLGGKKAYVIEKDTQNKQENVILCDSKTSALEKIGKVISYFTIVIPFFVLITKSFLRLNHHFKVIPTKVQTETNQNTNNDKDITSKVRNLMEKISPNEDSKEVASEISFFIRRGIVEGNEPLTVDLNSLGLSLDEADDTEEIINGTTVKKPTTLRKFTEDLISDINEQIKENSKYTKINDKRKIAIFMSSTNDIKKNGYFVKYNYSGCKNKGRLCLNEEDEKNRWIGRILVALKEKGYIRNYKDMVGGSIQIDV